jgi:hypothetical protein
MLTVMARARAPNRAIAPDRQRHTAAGVRCIQLAVSGHWRSRQPNTKNGSSPSVRDSEKVLSMSPT